MQAKILYLGLDPENWPQEVVHYPVIRTERLDTGALPMWSECTHVIFTSRRAVHHFWELNFPFGQRQAIAIGEATARELRSRFVFPLVAPEPTQEGIISLLKTLRLTTAYFFLPHSTRARTILSDFLHQKKIPFFSFVLYDTILQKPEPIPDLNLFEEIVFTSPSTVEGFLQIFGAFPHPCKLTAIGPITESALTKMRSLDTIIQK